MTTPCFYGAFGFLFALFWSLKKSYNQKFLTLFLLGGSIFAWYNNYSILYNYFVVKNSNLIGCTGKIVSNPFTTPCFIGACIFTISLAISYAIIKYKKNLTQL